MLTIIRLDSFTKWMCQLKDRRALGYIAARLDRLEDGHFGDSKALGEGVSELRIHHGAGYRIYFTRHADTVVVLLCGGDKGTQSRDIKRAKQLAARWRQENHD